MLQPIQGPEASTGAIMARIELAGAVTKGHVSSFAINASTGELTHRSSDAADNASQLYVWGVATASGAVGEHVTFVFKGPAYVVLTNATGGNIAIGDGLTRRAVAGFGNALMKVQAGDVILATAQQATAVAADAGWVMFDGIQGRFTTA